MHATSILLTAAAALTAAPAESPQTRAACRDTITQVRDKVVAGQWLRCFVGHHAPRLRPLAGREECQPAGGGDRRSDDDPSAHADTS